MNELQSCEHPATAYREDRCEALYRKMLETAIDESLCMEPDRNLRITMETIRNARKFIQGDLFPVWYRVIYGDDPEPFIKKLVKLWVELAKEPSKSREYRRIFNKGNGGVAMRKRVGERLRGRVIKHPADWDWDRPRDVDGRWI